MNPVVLERLRMQLREQRKKVVERIARLREQFVAEGPGQSVMDEGDEIQNRIYLHDAVSLAEQADAELQLIDRTLTRMRSAGYGKCDGCGRAIPVRRLQANPAARLCLTCQETAEAA